MMTRASVFSATQIAVLCLTLVGTAALSGCATNSASPSLFVLDDNQASSSQVQPDSAPTLMVDPIDLAPYLDQGGIVYQTAPYRVVIANDNRWAAPLAGGLTDSLYANLSNSLRGVELTRSSARRRDGYELQTRIDEFLGHFDGTAHVTGQWTLIGPQGNTLDTESFDKRIPLEQDGYPALVASLSTGWRQVAADMAPALQRSLSQQSGAHAR